ncbi:MAG: uracil-DNA glycosylase family protein [Patescibacteria group bacterium]
MKLQIEYLKKRANKLQKQYGSHNHKAICGAGCISNPKILFLFMNPTARNCSAMPSWKGIRAPWIGTKNIWKMLFSIGILEKNLLNQIHKSGNIWNENFANSLYSELSKKSLYMTNLAKCTQIDARTLPDSIFRNYLQDTLEEIYAVNPKYIISFGNQVSSILLDKKIKVSDYKNKQSELLRIKNKCFNVYPAYYPIGQGMRNINKTINRVRFIINKTGRF